MGDFNKDGVPDLCVGAPDNSVGYALVSGCMLLYCYVCVGDIDTSVGYALVSGCMLLYL